MKVEFNPMGTWIERIRAGGAGLGGVLTATGLGTEVEKGHEKIYVDGNAFLLFPPIHADVAVIKGHKADPTGNIQYRGAAVNTNPVMATAADYVIAEVDEIVETGSIEPNAVGTPGILVDAIVKGYAFHERKKIYTDQWLKTNKLAEEV
jgi:acetate CoA/acetoacetate CoA-transferase alpha subunit